MSQLQQLDLKHLEASPTQPRKSFNEKEMRDLEASLKEHGIIQPILVRRIAGRKKEAFEVIDGERRMRAATAVGQLTVPCLVVDMTDDEVIEAQMIGHLHRSDLHPMEEAVAFQKLLDRGTLTVAEIAGKVGKSAGYVQQRLVLNKLTDEARTLFEKDKLNAYQAVLIARCAPDFQAKILKKFEYHFANDYNLSGKDVFQFIQENMHAPLGKAPFSLTSETLIPAAGACANCPKRTANSAALFEDIGGEDLCTDRPCYDGKVKAHLIEVKEEMEQKTGEKVITVVTDWSKPPKGALPKSGYELASKGEKGAVQALVVAGDDIGKKKWVKLPKEETDPEAKSKAAEETKKYQAKRELENEIQQEQWRLMVFAVINSEMVVDSFVDMNTNALFTKCVDDYADTWDFDNILPDKVLDLKNITPAQRMAYRLLDMDANNGTLSPHATKFWKQYCGLDMKKVQEEAKATVKERRKKAAEEAAAAPAPEPEKSTKGAARRSKLAKKELKVE